MARVLSGAANPKQVLTTPASPAGESFPPPRVNWDGQGQAYRCPSSRLSYEQAAK